MVIMGNIDSIESIDTAARIRKRREELGLTIGEVAERAGVNRGTLYRYESGEIKSIGADRLERLSRVLGTDADYLLCRAGENGESRAERLLRDYLCEKLGYMPDSRDVRMAEGIMECFVSYLTGAADEEEEAGE